MWSSKKIQLSINYNILFRILQKRARSQKMISNFSWEGMLIVATIWKLSFKPPGTPRVLVNVKSTGVRFQLRPPRQLSTTLRHFISPPGLSLVYFKIRDLEKSCGKKEKDINGFRWTTIHLVKNTKSYVKYCGQLWSTAKIYLWLISPRLWLPAEADSCGGEHCGEDITNQVSRSHCSQTWT